MTDTTTPTPSTGAPSDATAPALPFGVSAEQYAAAIADAQALGIYDPNAPTMNPATKFESAAIEAFPEVTAPEQYQLHDFPIDTSDGDEAGARDFDMQRRGWLQAAGFPADLGRSMIAAVTDAERRLADLTPDQKEIQIRSARAAMTRLWGDRTQENVDLANRFISYVEARAPGVIDYLDKSGAANCPAVVAAVHLQAERFLAAGGRL